MISRFIKFCLVGTTGVFVDMAVLYFLADLKTLHWDMTLSKIIAVEVAILNNFLWNDQWTFGDVTPDKRNFKSAASRFMKFNLVCSSGMLLNLLLLNLLVRAFQINLYFANLIAIVLVTGWNFRMNYKYNWRAEKKCN